jgi:nucleoside-diphosphate-sugar epimerase
MAFRSRPFIVPTSPAWAAGCAPPGGGRLLASAPGLRPPVKIIGDGGTIRDYVYVGDLACAVVRRVAEHHGVGIVNVG